MGTVFLKLFNMCITASWLIIVVILLRQVYKKAPKWLSCLLWAVVAVRLSCPFSFESPLSLVPDIGIINPVSVPEVQNTINNNLPIDNSKPNKSVKGSFVPVSGNNQLQDWTFIAGIIWLAGLMVISGYAIVRFIKLYHKIQEAVPLQDNIWICDGINSSFIMGIVKPKIYISSSTSEEQIKYVLAHEQAHLKRKDHWWKVLGYLLFTIYWFNPLIWLAYILFCNDIELACDEKVIKDMDIDGKKSYSKALLACSVQKRKIIVYPLAFGETGVKERVRKVLKYKKPALWVTMAAAVLCVAVAICFLTNPEDRKNNLKKDGDIKQENIIQYHGHLYNKEDLSVKTAEWLEWYNGLSEEEQLAVDYVPLDLYEKENYGNNSQTVDALDINSGEDKTKDIDTRKKEGYEDENSAIAAAILDKNKSKYTGRYDFACCDFNVFKMSSKTDDGDTSQIATYYGLALYEEYKISGNWIEEISGSHIPVVIVFKVDKDGYHLKKYWEPRDGKYYASDIKKRFPADIAGDVINTQKYITQQIQSCYKQAIEYSRINTDKVAGRLLDTICSSPENSSNPQDYIDAHSYEYRELLYYGEYTLRYCFKRFKQGKETGLKGRIMSFVCEEILNCKDLIPANAATSETGQFWYDTLYAHASNVVNPYLK